MFLVFIAGWLALFKGVFAASIEDQISQRLVEYRKQREKVVSMSILDAILLYQTQSRYKKPNKGLMQKVAVKLWTHIAGKIITLLNVEKNLATEADPETIKSVFGKWSTEFEQLKTDNLFKLFKCSGEETCVSDASSIKAVIPGMKPLLKIMQLRATEMHTDGHTSLLLPDAALYESMIGLLSLSISTQENLESCFWFIRLMKGFSTAKLFENRCVAAATNLRDLLTGLKIMSGLDETFLGTDALTLREYFVNVQQDFNDQIEVLDELSHLGSVSLTDLTVTTPFRKFAYEIRRHYDQQGRNPEKLREISELIQLFLGGKDLQSDPAASKDERRTETESTHGSLAPDRVVDHAAEDGSSRATASGRTPSLSSS